MGALDKNILERAWDSAKDAGSYVQEKATTGAKAVGEAYNSVTGKARTAKDKMTGYIQGDIAIPKASEDSHNLRPKLKDALKGVIPDDKIEQFLDQDRITNEQVEEIVKPAFMTKITTRSKLVELKNATATHSELRDLVDRYGFAPIDPSRKVSIPSAAVKSSDLLRDIQVKFRTDKAGYIQAARSILNIGDPSIDNITVGRHIVVLKAQALIETIDAVMGRSQNSKDGERLTNKGIFKDTTNNWWGYYARGQWSIPLIGKVGSDNLAKAFASTNTSRLQDIGEASMDYSRTELTNDYIMRLMKVAANSDLEELTLFGETRYYSKGDEAQKLTDIGDELDAIRQAISSVDPNALRQVTDSVENSLNFGKDLVLPWVTIPFLALKAMKTAGIITPLIASHILHAKYGNGHVLYGKGALSKFFSAFTITGYVTYGTQRSFNKQEAAPTDPAELTRRQKAHIAPDDAHITTMREDIEKQSAKCIADITRLEADITRLEAIRRPTRRDITALSTAREELKTQEKRKAELGRINDLFDKELSAYKDRYDKGTFRTNHDSKNGIQTFFRSIKEGKITTIGGMWSDLRDEDKKGKEKIERTIHRPKEAFKRRWFSPSDIVDADVEAKAARKGAKADPLEVTLADGTKEKITLERTEFKTPAETMMYQLERFYQLKSWGSLYTAYKLALSQEAKAQKSVLDARAASTGPTVTGSSGGTTHVTIDKSDIAASVQAEATKSAKVVEIATSMSAINLGAEFDPNKLKITGFDASGNAIFNEAEIIGRGGFFSIAKGANTRAINSLWTKPVASGGFGFTLDKKPDFDTIKDVFSAKSAVIKEIKK